MHSKDCPGCEFPSRARASCTSAGRPTHRRLARPLNGFAPEKHSTDFSISSGQPAGGGHMRTRPEWESLLGRAMPCTSHLLTGRSVELGSLGSANPGANCVNNSLQSRNSHAKLQTTPRPSEINRHAAGTTSPTCSECDAKSISRLSDTTVRNRCQPSPRAKRTKRKECNQKKSSETRGVPPAATSGTPDREHPL